MAPSSTPNDTLLPADAQDTISSVAWSPTANYLAAASWDGKVRVYDIATDGSRARRIEERQVGGSAPVLSCDWLKDGSALLTGGADQTLHLLHTSTSQTTTLGTHTRTIKAVRRVNIPSSAAPIVATGSWDGTVKLWDVRAAGDGAIATLACAERVYAMDAAGTTLVIATAGDIHLVDLRSPTVFARTVARPMEFQTRAVGVAPGGRIWATASVEGRVAVNAVDETQKDTTNFRFRCHRKMSNGVTNVYSVNDVRFHPTKPAVFVTAGGDSSVDFWNRITHTRVNHYEVASSSEVARGAAITATGFSSSGALFAYAVGYDWSRGWSANTTDVVRRLMVHRMTAEDTQSRKK